MLQNNEKETLQQLGKFNISISETKLRSQKWVDVVSTEQLSTNGYFLGRFTQSHEQQQTGREVNIELPPTSSVGLFLNDLTPQKSSFGELEKPASVAVERLQATFKRLLANQILGQLLDVGRGSPLRV